MRGAGAGGGGGGDDGDADTGADGNSLRSYFAHVFGFTPAAADINPCTFNPFCASALVSQRLHQTSLVKFWSRMNLHKKVV